jgi:hypothetical protein
VTFAELFIVLGLFAALLWALGPLRRRVATVVARLIRRPVARVIRGDFIDARHRRDPDHTDSEDKS